MQFFKKTPSKSEFYLALHLSSDNGNAILLERKKNATHITILDEKYFVHTDGWDHIVENIDEVLTDLEKVNNVEISQVIFFMTSEMVTPERVIKPNYLTTIKKIAKELSLKPLGFIEQHEAVSIYREYKDETPLTGILVEFGQIEANVFLYKKGEVIARENITIQNEMFEELTAIFKKFKEQMVLPSKIIVYGESTSSTFISRMVQHKFEENLFVQMPHITSLNTQELTESMIYSFAQQIISPDEATQIDEKETEPIVEADIISEETIPAQETAVSGFIIGDDIKNKDVKAHPTKTSIMGIIPLFFSNLFTKLQGIKSMNGFRKSPMLLIISVVIILFALSITSLLFFHTATITMHVPKKEIEKKLDIEGIINSKEHAKLAVQELTLDTAAEDTIKTSGKKTIGEKAKGEVMIFNSQASERTFKSGTILATSDDIEFMLDNDVKVASASQSITGDGNVLTVTGKTKANATASLIGPTGNIAADVKLQIEDFPQSNVFAQTTNKFSGGTKKDVQTVSKEDIALIKNNVIKKMKGIQQSEAKNVTDAIISPLTSIELSDETYDKELGEEASSLSLQAKGKSLFYTYKKADLMELLKPLYKSDIPVGYVLEENGFNISIPEAEKDEDNITMNVTATAEAVMNVDKDSLVKSLKGKSTAKVKSLVNVPNTIEIKTLIPFLKDRLPFWQRNIILKVDTN